jgi:hypothetical protein
VDNGKRFEKAQYPGVVFSFSKRTGEKIFYIAYRTPDHRRVFEKVGRAIANDMTAAKANAIRSRRVEGGEKSNKDVLVERENARQWTVDALFKEYRTHLGRPADKACTNSDGDYYVYKHLKEPFGEKHPSEIKSLDVARFTAELKKQEYKPQSVKHCLALLVRLTRFGVKHKLTPPLDFQVEYPKFNNQVTNPIPQEKLSKLLDVLANYKNAYARALVLVALISFWWTDAARLTPFPELTGRSPYRGA